MKPNTFGVIQVILSVQLLSTEGDDEQNIYWSICFEMLTKLKGVFKIKLMFSNYVKKKQDQQRHKILPSFFTSFTFFFFIFLHNSQLYQHTQHFKQTQLTDTGALLKVWLFIHLLFT